MDEQRFNRRVKVTQELLGKIAKLDELKGHWKGRVGLSPQILNRLKSSVIITSTGASTRIEGSKMSDAAVARLLRGLQSKPPRNRDEQEVAGYAYLLGRIFDNYRTLKLSENNILHFHSILLQFSDKDQTHRGKYKSADNTVVMKDRKGRTIVLFAPTKPYLVKPQMDAAIDLVTKQLDRGSTHPLLVAANFIFEFLAIHPFLDGNGRLSRALTNLLLLRGGYAYAPYVSLDEIIEARKDAYYLALRATQRNHGTTREDLTPWLNFLLDALLEQAERAQQLMDAEQPEQLLSQNQEQVLALFTGEPMAVAAVHARLKGAVPLATIKQVLARLVTLGLLQRLGQGRGTRYRRAESSK